ncbi:MAG: Wzy polymerase domain-containing protein [Methylophaga sp.]
MSVTNSHHAEKEHTLLSIFSLTCLALMISVPFLVTYHMPPIASFFKEWLAALFGILAALYLAGRNRAQFQLPVVTFVPLLLIIVLGLQVWLLKPDYWQNQFIAALYLGFSALIIVLGSNLRHVLSLEKVVPTLAWAFTSGAALIMVLLFIGKFIPEESAAAFWILNGRAGNVGQTNQFSNFIALGLASLLYLRLTGRVKTSLIIIITAMLLIGLAQAGQRMAILYVLVLSVGGCLLLKTTAAQQTASIRPASLLWLIPGFILAQLVVPWMTFLEPAIMPAERLASTMGGESTRLMLLEQGWSLFLQYPWLGAGWAEFPWYNFNLTEDYPSLKGLWHNTHNLVIQLLAETGITGAFILLAGIGYWLWCQFTAPLTAERWWLLALLSVIGIHSLLEYPLWYVNFLAFASLLLGLGAEKPLQIRFRLAPILFIAVFIFALWSLGNLFSSYRQLETTLSTLREEGLPQAEIDKNLQKLLQLRSETVFTTVADNFLVRVLPDQPALMQDKLAISQLVVENWPGRVEVYNHAYYLAMNNKPVEAQKMMRKAIKQFPEYREAYHRYILAKAVKGNERVLPILIIVQDPYKAAQNIETNSQ